MQTKVLERIPDHRLRAYVVWLSRYPGDGPDVAETSKSLVPDARATYYWDSEGTLGRWFGRVVPLPMGKSFAWDVYFIFGPQQTWIGKPPAPVYWMHQLGQDERRLNGDMLARKIRRLLIAPGENE